MMNHKMLPSLRHLLLQEKEGEKREKEPKIMLNSVINFFLVFHKFTSTLVRPKYFYYECIKQTTLCIPRKGFPFPLYAFSSKACVKGRGKLSIANILWLPRFLIQIGLKKSNYFVCFVFLD